MKNTKNTYGYRTLDVLDIAFFLEDFFCSIAKGLNISFFDVLALLQKLNPLVQIVIRWRGTGWLLRHF